MVILNMPEFLEAQQKMDYLIQKQTKIIEKQKQHKDVQLNEEKYNNSQKENKLDYLPRQVVVFCKRSANQMSSLPSLLRKEWKERILVTRRK